jgi:hypothetical protein
MTSQDLKARVDDLAKRLFAVSEEVEQLLPHLTLKVDQKAAAAIITDLHWATENCTVIGLHQVGEALNDTMGYGRSDTE